MAGIIRRKQIELTLPENYLSPTYLNWVSVPGNLAGPNVVNTDSPELAIAKVIDYVNNIGSLTTPEVNDQDRMLSGTININSSLQFIQGDYLTDTPMVSIITNPKMIEIYLNGLQLHLGNGYQNQTTKTDYNGKKFDCCFVPQIVNLSTWISTNIVTASIGLTFNNIDTNMMTADVTGGGGLSLGDLIIEENGNYGFLEVVSLAPVQVRLPMLNITPLNGNYKVVDPTIFRRYEDIISTDSLIYFQWFANCPLQQGDKISLSYIK